MSEGAPIPADDRGECKKEHHQPSEEAAVAPPDWHGRGYWACPERKGRIPLDPARSRRVYDDAKEVPPIKGSAPTSYTIQALH